MSRTEDQDDDADDRESRPREHGANRRGDRRVKRPAYQCRPRRLRRGPRSVERCHRQAFHYNKSIRAGRRIPRRAGRLAVLEARLTKEASMITPKLSVVAIAIIAAAVFISTRSVGERPACCPAPSKGETGVLALAGALAVEPDKDSRNAPAPAAATADFSVEGMFVDCCSCNPPCPCELTEVAMGCKGIGVHQISRGTYAGDD